MNKLTVFLIALGSFLLGVVGGFLLAPVKNGFECGNNNGNTYNYYGSEPVDQNEEENN